MFRFGTNELSVPGPDHRRRVDVRRVSAEARKLTDSLNSILIVDDSIIARKMTMKTFKLDRPNVDLLMASGGVEGVELYKSNRPDLVLMDLTMPDMMGFEALEIIREFDPNARVIIVSADIQAKARERCENSGAIAVLPKPFKIEAVNDIIRQHFSA